MALPRREFHQVLPLLMSTYTQGRLVPFLGAGMSAGRLALWDEFVKKLEADAGTGGEQSLKWSYDVRAQAACTKIRNSRGHACFLKAVREALVPGKRIVDIPSQTKALAAICWPLVVSTNYDDLYLGTCLYGRPPETDLQEPDIRLVGRSPKDCKTVLSSLHGPFDRRYIWHIQGFLGGQFGNGVENLASGLQELQDQLVIGHAEYSAVTNASPHFRRCFGQLFQSRSLLFLGSSLTEAYFTNLFGEVLELCGPSHIPHFALARKGEVDTHFLAEQMNITVCEFDDYEQLPVLLEDLRCAIASPHARVKSWSFAVESDFGKKGELQIVREDAPLVPRTDETIGVVTRRDPQTDLPQLPKAYAWLSLRDLSPRHIGVHAVKYGDMEIYALTARCRGDEDDSAVDEAVIEFLDTITASTSHSEKHKIVHLQLSPNRGTVPPVFAFMKVVRAFGKWARNRPMEAIPLTLILHIQTEVEFNLTSGRINVLELLTSEWIRFWALVASDTERDPVRRVLMYKEDANVEDVLADLGVPFGRQSAEWSLSICPAPRQSSSGEKTTWSLDGSRPTLLTIGVLFGSIVTFD